MFSTTHISMKSACFLEFDFVPKNISKNNFLAFGSYRRGKKKTFINTKFPSQNLYNITVSLKTF